MTNELGTGRNIRGYLLLHVFQIFTLKMVCSVFCKIKKTFFIVRLITWNKNITSLHRCDWLKSIIYHETSPYFVRPGLNRNLHFNFLFKKICKKNMKIFEVHAWLQSNVLFIKNEKEKKDFYYLIGAQQLYFRIFFLFSVMHWCTSIK